ncbi:hypothetical protein MXB_4179 [Myxobolus squamalis]|nr:hypothetical protein MXB_4179 [Myxobolus squamalis]
MKLEYVCVNPYHYDRIAASDDQPMVATDVFISNKQPFSAILTNLGSSETSNGIVSSDYQINNAEESVTIEFWCTVIYHEFEVTVGEPFKVPISNSAFTIDGYFDVTGSSGSRMSLGQYTNIHRTNASDRTRMYVGKVKHCGVR